MAIKGLTHAVDSGALLKNSQFKGKINTGWAPNEGPNKTSSPMQAGHFIVMREGTDRVSLPGGGSTFVKKWSQNQTMQKLLCETNANKKTVCGNAPRYLEFVCLHHTMDEFWTSRLAKYNQTQRMLCSSNGEGTVAKELKVNGETSSYVTRIQKIGDTEYHYCPYRSCPDYMAGRCGEDAQMLVFPKFDISTEPYKVHISSVVSVSNIEAELEKLWNLLMLSHRIRQANTAEKLDFTGFFGLSLVLELYQANIKGKKQWVCRLHPSTATNKFIMDPINGRLVSGEKDMMLGQAPTVPLLSSNNIDVPKPGIGTSVGSMLIDHESGDDSFVPASSEFDGGDIATIEYAEDIDESEEVVAVETTDTSLLAANLLDQ